jgi:hypothetical protein
LGKRRAKGLKITTEWRKIYKAKRDRGGKIRRKFGRK